MSLSTLGFIKYQIADKQYRPCLKEKNDFSLSWIHLIIIFLFIYFVFQLLFKQHF